MTWKGFIASVDFQINGCNAELLLALAAMTAWRADKN